MIQMSLMHLWCNHFITQYAPKRYHIFGQVNLGEVLSCDNEEGYRFINSKRVDICITDRKYLPIAIIEVNGSGHDNDTSGFRDGIKKIALENAGIQYIAIRDIFNDDIETRLKAELGGLLDA